MWNCYLRDLSRIQIVFYKSSDRNIQNQSISSLSVSCSCFVFCIICRESDLIHKQGVAGFFVSSKFLMIYICNFYQYYKGGVVLRDLYSSQSDSWPGSELHKVLSSRLLIVSEVSLVYTIEDICLMCTEGSWLPLYSYPRKSQFIIKRVNMTLFR